MTSESLREALRVATPERAARLVLGGTLTVRGVAATVVEVEAYGGPPDSRHPDPAAHTWPGPTSRNQVMFGDAGHLYTYLSHGIHVCANITYRAPGDGAGLLLRAARIEHGHDEVQSRRLGVVEHHWARGPGNLGRALGIELYDGGTDLLTGSGQITFVPDGSTGREIATGPRVGVSRAADRPWRFWIPGAREVSLYRRSPRAALGQAR